MTGCLWHPTEEEQKIDGTEDSAILNTALGIDGFGIMEKLSSGLSFRCFQQQKLCILKSRHGHPGRNCSQIALRI